MPKLVLVIIGGMFWSIFLGALIGDEYATGIFLFQAIYCRVKYFSYRKVSIDPNMIPVLNPEVVY